MATQIQVLFDRPQQEIQTLLEARLVQCQSASLVSGFVTVEGVEAIATPLRASPAKLRNFVVGAGTYRAYEAFDRLVAAGVPLNKFFVHLGHSRGTKAGARHAFYRYHPMLHSKVFYLDMGDGSACAFIGSHNITGFALHGLNGEAGVLVEGPTNDRDIEAVRRHIDECVAQSVPYTPGMKEAYAWWATEFIEGFRDKFDDRPREGEANPTILILAVHPTDPLPKKGDVIYFELPTALGTVNSLSVRPRGVRVI